MAATDPRGIRSLDMLEQKQFTGESSTAAKKAATDWWAGQTGRTHVSAYVGPADEHLARQTGHRWVATIIYETEKN